MEERLIGRSPTAKARRIFIAPVALQCKSHERICYEIRYRSPSFRPRIASAAGPLGLATLPRQTPSMPATMWRCVRRASATKAQLRWSMGTRRHLPHTSLRHNNRGGMFARVRMHVRAHAAAHVSLRAANGTPTPNCEWHVCALMAVTLAADHGVNSPNSRSARCRARLN